jgi:hypothetical protein
MKYGYWYFILRYEVNGHSVARGLKFGCREAGPQHAHLNHSTFARALMTVAKLYCDMVALERLSAVH